MKLTPEIKNAINNAFTSGKPVLVAYVDEDGQPSLSFRGSTQAYSDNQLAIWVRNPEGGLQKALEKNPRISLMYRDPTPESRSMLQFKGTARREANETERNTVYDNAPEPERNADREKKGFALIIDLEKVDGFFPGGRAAMRK
jgi:predicted pyridoxine 5'-phosphate oxidase superfamily flavin-nucleotide-binding protein